MSEGYLDMQPLDIGRMHNNMKKITYLFSKKDLEALSKLIKYANDNEALSEESAQIIKTFNGPAFKILGKPIKLINKNNHKKTMENAMKKEQKKLTKAIASYLKDNSALLKKHKLMSRVVIVSPQGKKPSLILKFAIWILNKAGAGFDTEFSLVKK